MPHPHQHDDVILGFDAAAASACIVAMRRDPEGVWHLERPDDDAAARRKAITELCERAARQIADARALIRRHLRDRAVAAET